MNKFNLLKNNATPYILKILNNKQKKKVTPGIKITQEQLSQKLNAFQ